MPNSDFPQELSFYIIANRIFYNTKGDGIPHIDLWRKIVSKVFTRLDFESRQDLMEYPYGIERGRVVFFEGVWRLYGTPGCRPYQEELETYFKLANISHQVDFEFDRHYRLIFSDVSSIKHSLKLAGENSDVGLSFIELK